MTGDGGKKSQLTISIILAMGLIAGSMPAAATSTGQDTSASVCPKIVDLSEIIDSSASDGLAWGAYTDCKKEKMTERVVDSIRTPFEGYEHQARTYGESLQENGLPGTDLVGDILIDVANQIRDRLNSTADPY